MPGSSMYTDHKDFAISFQALLLLIEVILPSLAAGGLAATLVYDIAECGVPDAGISSCFSHLFYTPSSILAIVHGVVTQIHSTMFVISITTLYRVGPSRAHIVRATFVDAVTAAGGYVVIVWPYFRLLHGRGDLEKPLTLLGGGAVYLGGKVCIAVMSLLACAVPVLKDTSDSGFRAIRRRLALVGTGRFWALAAVCTLLDCILAPLAVLTATAPSQVLGAGMAINAVMWATVVVTLVAQPVVRLVVWDNYHSAFPAGTGDNTSDGNKARVKVE